MKQRVQSGLEACFGELLALLQKTRLPRLVLNFWLPLKLNQSRSIRFIKLLNVFTLRSFLLVLQWASTVLVDRGHELDSDRVVQHVDAGGAIETNSVPPVRWAYSPAPCVRASDELQVRLGKEVSLFLGAVDARARDRIGANAA